MNSEGMSMRLDKSQVVELLQAWGDQAQARRAERELADPVDTDEHAELLIQLGLDPAGLAVVCQLTGGGRGLRGLL
jgi:hypothetical protein